MSEQQQGAALMVELDLGSMYVLSLITICSPFS